jgi:hypothetical protein
LRETLIVTKLSGGAPSQQREKDHRDFCGRVVAQHEDLAAQTKRNAETRRVRPRLDDAFGDLLPNNELGFGGVIVAIALS